MGRSAPTSGKVGIAFVERDITSADAIVIRPLESALRGFVLMTVSTRSYLYAVTAQTMNTKALSKCLSADWTRKTASALLLVDYHLFLPAARAAPGSFESAIQ